jgi:predicted glycosyltransferase
LSTLEPKKILIAPLDWGLGHTARCIPLIRHIKSLGHIPLVAGNASQEFFIKETFGNIDFIHLPGYKIIYSKWNRFSQAGLLSQLPGINKTINNEHKWLRELSQNMQIDGIVSDNRYGLFHPQIPSVIMTHQLLVQSGMGNIANRAVQKIHYRYLERFNNIWVVDNPGIPNLAGKLSQTNVLPRNTKYIGLLSRFEGAEKDSSPGDNLLILLSGPEPQRSILSGLLWRQVQRYSGKVIFIEGNEAAIQPSLIPSHITYYKRLTDQHLAPLLHDAGMVICRSGYSTIMDLAALHKKAILIPTPGQTEQKYLARYLNEQSMFYTAKQKGFNLDATLKEAQQFPFHFPDLRQSYSVYKKVVKEWIEEL